jgi:hypothetical protein
VILHKFLKSTDHSSGNDEIIMTTNSPLKCAQNCAYTRVRVILTISPLKCAQNCAYTRLRVTLNSNEYTITDN